MGVIRVNEKAARLGFTHGDPDWINLGQGQPEVGELSGAQTGKTLKISAHWRWLAPVRGLISVRSVVRVHPGPFQ